MTNSLNTLDAESLNQLFELLSHQYRRHVLRVLADPDDWTGTGIDANQLMGTGGEPDILHLELLHNHFPKLDQYGLVDWNPQEGTLRRGPRFEEVEPFLELLDEEGRFPTDRL